MEQQKVVWIIFSVALFVLVVVGVGLIWFFPQEGMGTEMASAGEGGGQSDSEEEFDPIEWVKTSGEYPDFTPAEEESEEGSQDFVIVYGEDEEKDTSPESRETPAAGLSGKEGGRLPSPEESGGTAAVEETSPAVSVKPAEKKPAPAVKQPAPAKEVTVAEYWIQAGSYKSKTRAADVKTALSEKGVESRLTTKDIDGVTYYRVRIGPYKEQGEAEKFLSWVKDMQGFESSYVSMVYAKRRLN